MYQYFQNLCAEMAQVGTIMVVKTYFSVVSVCSKCGSQPQLLPCTGPWPSDSPLYRAQPRPMFKLVQLGPHRTGSQDMFKLVQWYRPPPKDMFKLVQCGPQCTGTPPLPDAFILVQYVAHTDSKRAVGIRLKCLPVC